VLGADENESNIENNAVDHTEDPYEE